MNTEKKDSLFGGKGGSRDPYVLLLDEIIEEMPVEKQIEKITHMLKNAGGWGVVPPGISEKFIPFVEVLDKLFEDKAEFRALLMEICDAIPITSDKEELAVKLRLVMLAKIIEGWDWIYLNFSSTQFLKNDAENCFLFLCKTYNKAPVYQNDDQVAIAKQETGKIRRGIRDILHKHLKLWRYGHALNPWILHADAYGEIAFELIKIRASMNEAEESKREIQFLSALDFHERSASAISLTTKFMGRVRLLDELVAKLVSAISPADKFGNPNPDNRFSFLGDVKFQLLSEDKARVIVEFLKHTKPASESEACEKRPQIIKDIIAMREQIFAGTENLEKPFKIMLEVRGSDGRYMHIEV